MGETKTVSDVIRTVILYALGLGLAGTLVEQTGLLRIETEKGIRTKQISYSKWNRQLHERPEKK